MTVCRCCLKLTQSGNIHSITLAIYSVSNIYPTSYFAVIHKAISPKRHYSLWEWAIKFSFLQAVDIKIIFSYIITIKIFTFNLLLNMVFWWFVWSKDFVQCQRGSFPNKQGYHCRKWVSVWRFEFSPFYVASNTSNLGLSQHFFCMFF